MTYESTPVYESTPDTSEPERPTVHECDSGHFDRTICADPCGRMHSFCATCGRRADPCAHDPREDPSRV